jgi:rhodanese-related sulfurtransferase
MRFDNIHLQQAYWILEHIRAVLIDVREKEEYEQFHLKGAVNIPYDELDTKKLDTQMVYIVYCDNGMQSMRAARDLAMDGYRVYNVLGGLKGNEKDIDIQRSDKVQ